MCRFRFHTRTAAYKTSVQEKKILRPDKVNDVLALIEEEVGVLDTTRE